MKPFSIDGRLIGPGQSPYVIAEMSGNHNGDIERAFRLMQAAKDAGADAVKLQTYTADTITIDHDGPGFVVEGGLWDGRRLYDLYQEAHTPWEWHEQLFAKGRELGITVFSSPFDRTAIDFLADLDAPAYKIASFEAIDLPLIRHAASKAKPLVISTGMCSAEEIQEAVNAAREAGCSELVLLHCVSTYPAPYHEANLRAVAALAERFDSIAGLSDHTMGVAVPIAAVALGAHVIEKHFTLRRADGGPDSAFSLEPEELKAVCDGCRIAASALGSVRFGPTDSERESVTYRRSLYVVEDIAAGAALTERNVRSIRPGYGLPPKYLPEVVGRATARDLCRGEPLDWSMLA